MKKTVIATTLALFAASAVQAATEADVENTFNPYKGGFPKAAGLSAGTVINKGNVDQFKDVVPAGVYKLLKDGETFKLGSIDARAMHTPGHTPACMTYLIGDAGFVGDTLFMPDYGTARADFPGGDARMLYHSIRRLMARMRELGYHVIHTREGHRPDLADLPAQVSGIRHWLQSVGVALPRERVQALAEALGALGATRLCPLGTMAEPTAEWHHDGRPNLGDLARWTDCNA